VGSLKLVAAGKGVSLHDGSDWLASGFALSEDLPLMDSEFLPQGRLWSDAPRAVGAVDDARPDRWGEKVIRFVDKPQRLSLINWGQIPIVPGIRPWVRPPTETASRQESGTCTSGSHR
jgi:serine/threonine-protein kinase HipA